jgi:branched-chain amino acid transport system substrate-binding protein
MLKGARQGKSVRVFWLVSGWLFLVGCSSRSGTEPILIGHIAPLDKPSGENARQGILLAVEEVNAGSKVAGQRVAVVHVDRGHDPNGGQAQAVRLLAVNKAVGLLLDIDPSQLDRTAKELEPYGVPLVTTESLAAAPASESTFAVNLTAGQQGHALAQYTLAQLKPGRLAVVTDGRSASAAAFTAAFVKEFRQDDGIRVEQWTYDKVDRLPDLIASVKKMQPDAVLISGSAGDLSALRKQLYDAEVRGPILFGGDDPAALPADVPGDLYWVTSYLAGATADDQEFARKYRERFHETPDLHAALAYDAARILFRAIERSNTTQGTAVRKELAELENFPGLTGSFSFNKDRTPRRVSLVVRGKDGRAEIVERMPPEK